MQPTIHDVARIAGVAASTVSRALRDDPRITEPTRLRVMEAVEELHYVPRAAAQSLAGVGICSIGMVLPQVTGSYYAELAVGFEARASELDCSVVVLQVGQGTDNRSRIRRMAGQVDALAFLAKSGADDELVARVARGRPTVTVSLLADFGADITAQLSSGDIQLEGVRNELARVNLSTSSGRISVRDVNLAGNVELRSSSGRIDFERFSAARPRETPGAGTASCSRARAST